MRGDGVILAGVDSLKNRRTAEHGDDVARMLAEIRFAVACQNHAGLDLRYQGVQVGFVSLFGIKGRKAYSIHQLPVDFPEADLRADVWVKTLFIYDKFTKHTISR
ncbi:hypothetical protein SAMN05428952_11073 [Nitrosomonas sp. Nm132]|nr:hypothetical protein SAMN05428952_11073 [Nitrosomonas sp. Nm132]